MKLTGRWFPQIVQWESISNIYITKIVVLVSEPVRGRSRATELPCCFYHDLFADSGQGHTQYQISLNFGTQGT